MHVHDHTMLSITMLRPPDMLGMPDRKFENQNFVKLLNYHIMLCTFYTYL